MWVVTGGLGILGNRARASDWRSVSDSYCRVILLTALDMAKKIRESAGDQKVADRAAALERRIDELYAKLRGINER
jgi:hypothetical protein